LIELNFKFNNLNKNKIFIRFFLFNFNKNLK
jgi:hypothetical protein